MTMQTTPARSSGQAAGPVSAACALAAAILTLLACSPTLAAEANVTVENPWMRFIIKARPAAGYFTLRNNGDKAVELTSASSSACGMLMMHQSRQENGVDKMLPVKSVPVPAHGSVSFAPGNYHLMCMSPTSAMALGANVPVTLKFIDGQTVTAQFPVKGPGGK